MENGTLISMESRSESFQRLDAERAAFINELIAENAQLKASLHSIKSDYEDQSESRRSWQSKSKEAEDRLREMVEMANSTPFAVVLIDGDGYIFQEEFLRQGAVGGAIAAQQLLEKLQDYFGKFDGSKGWRIMVRIFVNLEGLLQTCVNLGLLREESTLRQFASGFTQNQPLFDFVDAGHGKERADHKIKELFNLFVKDIHCKHIVLGCCHDNGYVVILDPYKHNRLAASRITLLQGPRCGREYATAPFETLKLNELFREIALPANNAVQKRRSKGSTSKNPGKSAKPHGNGNHGLLDKPTTFSRAIYPKDIYLNKDDERVDKSFPEPSPGAWANVNRRSKQKLCMEYTLRGYCDNKQCAFAHVPDLPLDEVYALAKRARLLPCKIGSACRLLNCFYGHECPGGEICTKVSKCYFTKIQGKDNHGKDNTAVAQFFVPL